MPSLDFEKEKIAFRDYYNERHVLFADAVTSYRTLLTLLLADQDEFPAPQVTGRVKEREECINKFARKYLKKCDEEKTPYEIKHYVTDIIGLRLVCLYETDIQLIRQVLLDNFEIVDETDKSRTLESHDDTFGYKGLHLDLKLKGNRSTLPEYSRFRDYQFEVQIRTVVQDAWSVLDHKIKYKKNIPHHLKRRINRIAALFELADQEFLNIRNETSALEKDPSKAATIPQSKTTITAATDHLTPFSFLRVAEENFPGYRFDGYKIDGFVQELIDVDSDITTSSLTAALGNSREALDHYREYQRAKYLNRLNPYTTVRHALYLSNKEKYASLLFELQRNNFDEWLSSNNSR